MPDLSALLSLVALAAVFYLLILRPARTRQRAVLELQASLQAGQEVMTTSGLYARIVDLTEDEVVLEIAPGVTTRWARAAVGQVQPATSAPTDAEAAAAAKGAPAG